MGLEEAMRIVTDRILADLARRGPGTTSYFVFGWGDEEPKPWPTVYDINCGSCETWADAVTGLIPGAEALWDDQLPGFNLTSYDAGDHCVLVYEGRYYDAECHLGVDYWEDLPFWRNKGKTRTEILQERGELPLTNGNLNVQSEERRQYATV